MRITQDINDNWTFRMGDESETVRLPHTWNAADGQDGSKGYRRGKAVYSRLLPAMEGCVQLEFLGVNSVCEVLVDGRPVGSHRGGYSRFRFDISAYVRKESVLTVLVDNTDQADVYPSMADFTFWGGIYRGVRLITTGKTRFSFADYGSDGLYITPDRIDSEWLLGIKALVEEPVPGARVVYKLYDREGLLYRSTEREIEQPGAVLSCGKPNLWDGRRDPYLYTLTAEIVLPDGSISDNLTVKTGFRTFCIDAEKGFFLNGKPYKLHGVCRHQDREDMGNALTEKEHREDLALILETGANAVRLAHYQQSGFFYDLCDENGLLIWAEIPMISRFSPKKQANARSQLLELIKQNYNHPGIFCWGIHNEITIGGLGGKKLQAALEELAAIVRRVDTTRPSTCAQVSMVPIDSPLNGITDLLGYNHYFGWYADSCDGLERWLDRFHAQCPEKKLCLSEYGAEAILSWQTETPQQGDYSEAYQCLFHEHYLREIESRDWLWGSFLWNCFDFGSAQRNEGGVRGRNNKGLVTYDRKTKKDSFYLYQAAWSEEKMLHLCGKRYVNRVVGTTDIKVYSNQPAVTLSFGTEKRTLEGKTVFVFENIPVKAGENIYTVKAGRLRDTLTVQGVSAPDERYRMPDSGRSFVRNWFTPDAGLREDCLSVNDRLGDVLASAEVRKIAENALGERATRIMAPASILAGGIRVKTLLKLSERLGIGGDWLPLADRFLQTIKK